MSGLFDIKGGHLGQQFCPAAKPVPDRKSAKDSVVVCVRMSAAQRDRLRRDAKRRNLSAYVRSCLFEGQHGNGVPENAAIARMLGQLGQSGLARNMNAVAVAARTGTLQTGPDLNAKLEQACADIKAIRRDLIAALGIKPE